MKTRMMMACCVGLFLLLTIVPAVTHAEVPDRINYQGFLTDSDGNPVPDDIYEMVFTLHTTEVGDTGVWQQTSSDVSIVDGIYNVELGPFIYPGQVFDGDLYLEVEVNGEVLSPRQRLSATAYAMKAAKAEDADTLDGKDSTSLDQSAHVTRTDNPHSVTAAQTGAAAMSDISWGNLSGIPGDIADGDQVGIETETDPTIIDPSVKDGVSWGELSGIPSGFLDGVDNDSGGDITGVIAGTGLDGGGASGTVTLHVDVPFQLQASSAIGILNGYNTYGTGYGVRGEARNTGAYENYGGYFTAAGETGRGVYGEAENEGTGRNYGGYFISAGETGRGVAGKALGISGIGMYGKATGAYGKGVYGEAINDGAYENYGGYFRADGDNGRGVYGEATGTGDVTNYGGYFKAAGAYGKGVEGQATDTGVSNNFGGWFYAAGKFGAGVYGEGSGTQSKGVFGKASGTYGKGVEGYGGDYDFYAAGPGTNYGYASSIRWKQNIREIEGALEKVMQMQGVYFDWDEEHGGHHDVGFIAEEVGQYVPEAVSYEQDSEFATGMDYGMMTPILLQAIKEQQVIISKLRVEMEKLKAEIKNIKARR